MIPEEYIRTTGRPTVQQARILSDQILKVSRRQFLERGYNGTTFGSIADEVRTSRGALYTRFQDKSSLFAKVVRNDIEQMCARTVFSGEDCGSISEILSRRATQIVSVSMEPQHTALYKIIVSDAPRTNEIDHALMQAWAFFVAHIRSYFELSESIFIKSTEKSANMFLGLVFQPVHRAIVYGYPMPTTHELSEHIDASVLLFLGGVGRMELEGRSQTIS